MIMSRIPHSPFLLSSSIWRSTAARSRCNSALSSSSVGRYSRYFEANKFSLSASDNASTSIRHAACAELERLDKIDAYYANLPLSVYLPQHFLYFSPLPQGHGSLMALSSGFYSKAGDITFVTVRKYFPRTCGEIIYDRPLRLVYAIGIDTHPRKQINRLLF